MRNIRYIGNSAVNRAFYPQTGIIWTPGKVDTVLDDKIAAEMLMYTDVFEDAGDSFAVNSGAMSLDPTAGLQIGGAAPNAQQRAAVRAGIGALKNTSGRTKVCVFGDSYAAYENWTAYGVGAMSGSLWHKALAIVGYNRVDLNYQGVSGDTAALLLARVASVIADDAAVVLGNIGVNDFYGYDRTAAAVLADVQSVITQIIASGKKVVWANCPTQGTARVSWSLAKQKKALEYNRLLGVWAEAIDGLYVVDLCHSIVDMSDSTNAAPIATALASADLIHLSAKGALLFGRAAADVLNSVIPQKPRRFDPLDGFGEAGSLSVLPVGRGQMSGTGGSAGTATTAGANGIPASWTVRRSSGTIATVIANKVTDDTDGVWLEAEITAGSAISTVETVEMLCATFHANLSASAGKRMRLVAEVRADSSDGLNLVALNPRLYTYDNATIRNSEWSRTLGGNVACDAYKYSEVFTIETPYLEVPAGLTAAQVYVIASFVGTGVAKVSVRNISVEMID